MSSSARTLLNAGALALIATMALAAPPPTASMDDRGKAVGAWQHFVAARSAAGLCPKPGTPVSKAFTADFNTAQQQATASLERQTRGAPDKVAGALKDATGRIDGKVHDEVKQHGCASPKIKELMDFYALHAGKGASRA